MVVWIKIVNIFENLAFPYGTQSSKGLALIIPDYSVYTEWLGYLITQLTGRATESELHCYKPAVSLLLRHMKFV